MAISRRHLMGFLGLTVYGAETSISLDALRNVFEAHGIHLSDDQLRVVKPVLEQRVSQLQALREFAIDDTVAPTQGIVIHGSPFFVR
jgi:hypothetical protein